MATDKIDLNNLDKSDWKTYRFDEIAINISERVDPNNTDLEVYVGLEHIDSESLHIKRFGTPDDVNGQKLKFYEGDIIFGRRRAYQRKAGIAPCDGFCSAHALVLRANPDVISPELFPFFLHSDLFMNRAVDISAGSLSPTINWKNLKGQEFLIPSSNNHELFSSLFLSAYEANIRDKNLFTQATIVKDSMIKHYLTSPESKGKLSDYCEVKGIKIGPFGSLLHKSDYQEKGIPVVMPTDIVNGEIKESSVARISVEKANELSSYRLQKNDILFPRRGDLTKRALVQPHQENWICGTGTIRARLAKNIDPRIVYFAVTSESTNNWLAGAAVGTTMPNLNASTINNIPLHLPEGKDAKTIVKNVESTVDALQFSQSKVSASRCLLQTLINQVF